MKHSTGWQAIQTFMVIACVTLAWGAAPGWSWPVPDSGQSKCYDDVGNELNPCPQPGEPFYGQDGNYPGNPRSYTKLDESGNELPDTASAWTSVRDNVTGMEWEVKTTDGSIHDSNKTYTWCDTNPETNGGYAGSCDGSNTEAFISTLNGQNFGGHSDWRLPTIKDLQTLVNRGVIMPTIDTTNFPNTKSASYWSATTRASNTNYAWSVYFGNGDVGDYNKKSNSYYVRAVRSGQCVDYLRKNGDGTVTDVSRGLMWQQTSGPAVSWQGALAYGEAQALAGLTDWRLPASGELLSLVDYGIIPAIDVTVFPGTPGASSYWSATTIALSTDYAWLVNFNGGNDNSYNKSNSYYVRAVRSGQCFGPLAISQPLPGATVAVGNTVSIAWNPNGLGGKVAIALSRQGGKADTFETIAASVANSGSYSWQASGPLTVNAVLRIEPLLAPEQATTVGLFSIATLDTLAIKVTPQTNFTTYDLASSGLYSNGMTLPLAAAWTLSAPDIATISGHTLTAQKKGWVTVSGEYQGLTASLPLLLFDPVQPDDSEAEPNNDQTSADLLPKNEVWQGKTLNGDTDYFQIDLAQEAIIQVGYVNTSISADIKIDVVDSTGNLLATVTSENGSTKIISCGLPAGKHLIRVQPTGDIDQDASYFLSWRVESLTAPPGDLPLVAGSSQQTTLFDLNDTRIFPFPATEGQTLTLHFNPTSPIADYILTLRDSFDNPFNVWTSSNGQPVMITTALAAGDYSLDVSHNSDVDAAHPFTVSLANTKTAFEIEPNASSSQATPLEMDAPLEAMLPPDDTDFFNFSLAQPTSVHMGLTSTSNNADYRLTLYQGSEANPIDGVSSTNGATVGLDIGLLAGDYLVKIETNGDSDQDAIYTLSLSNSDITGLEVEPNDSTDFANGLDPLVPRVGRIYSVNDTDIYGYSLTTATSYTITFTPFFGTSADYALDIINSAGTILSSTTSVDGAVNAITLKAKKPDTFYLLVKASGDIDPIAIYTISCTGDITVPTTTTTTTTMVLNTTTTTVAPTTTTIGNTTTTSTTEAPSTTTTKAPSTTTTSTEDPATSTSTTEEPSTTTTTTTMATSTTSEALTTTSTSTTTTESPTTTTAAPTTITTSNTVVPTTTTTEATTTTTITTSTTTKAPTTTSTTIEALTTTTTYTTTTTVPSATTTEPTTTTTETPTTTTTSIKAAEPTFTTTTTIPGNESVTLPVSAGWSLLSSTIGFQSTTVFGDTQKFTSVWKWTDGGTGTKTWAVYLPGGDNGATYAQSKGFKALSSLSSGEGFWVNGKADDQVKVSGTPAYGEMSFAKGWNLVGVKGKQQITAASLGQVTSVWKWTTVNNIKTWAVYLPGEADKGVGYAVSKGFGQFTTINPGEGFWVNMGQ